MRILLVEDDHDLGNLYNYWLTKFGHKVTHAKNGGEAMCRMMPYCTCETVSKDQFDEPYDLVMTDIHMPVMSGLELVTRLRQQQWNGRILVVTSDDDIDLSDHLMKLNCEKILIKPVSKRLILEAVEQASDQTNYATLSN